MKKTINKNYRVEVYPVYYSENHKHCVATLKEIEKDIIRHVDGFDNTDIEWDTKEVCEFCEYEWEIDEDGLPMCCQKAVKEAICKSHLVELNGGEICQK